jgi:hypothetical protein
MMVFLLIQLVSLLNLSWADDKWPECEKIGGYKIPAEVKRVDCDKREIAHAILAQEEVAPTILYHFGNRKILEENIAAHTIPQKAWDEFIVGEKGRFSLNPYRRGLYGTTTLDTNTLSSPSHSWLMEIHLKADCVKPDHVATLIHLPEDTKFQNWFNHAAQLPFLSLVRFRAECYPPGKDGTPSSMAAIGPGPTNQKCEETVSRFLNEAGIKVVQDQEVQKAFYVRDRACIEEVLGTPADLLRIFSDKTYLWLNSCADDPLESGTHTDSIFTLLIQAFKSINRPVEPAIYERLKANVSYLSDRRNRDLHSRLSALIDAHERCSRLEKMPDFRLHVPNSFGLDLKVSELDKLCVSAAADHETH